MNWTGGLPAYLETLYASLDKDYQGWSVAKGVGAKATTGGWKQEMVGSKSAMNV